jgi:hypothetical protein
MSNQEINEGAVNEFEIHEAGYAKVSDRNHLSAR